MTRKDGNTRGDHTITLTLPGNAGTQTRRENPSKHGSAQRAEWGTYWHSGMLK